VQRLEKIANNKKTRTYIKIKTTPSGHKKDIFGAKGTCGNPILNNISASYFIRRALYTRTSHFSPVEKITRLLNIIMQ